MKADQRQRRASTLDDHRQRVLRALAFVEARLDGCHSLQSLARVAHTSPFHFQRVFADLVGETPAQFVRRLRIERAALELRDGDDTVGRIAQRAGYGETAAFTRSFQARFGETPSAARQRGLVERTRSPHTPACVRIWARQAREDGQACFEPIATSSRGARSRPAARLVQLPPRLRVAFLRRGPGEGQALEDFQRLGRFASRRGSGDDLMFVRLHHDDEAIAQARTLRLDRAVVIGPRRRGEGGLGVTTLEGGVHVAASAEGSAADVLRVRRWLERTALRELGARRSAGPVIEVALDDPRVARRGPQLFDVLVPAEPPEREIPWYWRYGRPPTPRGNSR